MAERPCDFKGVSHFEAKFGAEGLCFAPISTWTVRMGNDYFAVGRFHTKKLCSRLY